MRELQDCSVSCASSGKPSPLNLPSSSSASPLLLSFPAYFFSLQSHSSPQYNQLFFSQLFSTDEQTVRVMFVDSYLSGLGPSREQRERIFIWEDVEVGFSHGELAWAGAGRGSLNLSTSCPTSSQRKGKPACA